MHRVVIKNQINDKRLCIPFEAGDQILNDNNFCWLKNEYPSCIVEIPMNEQEWLQYLSDLVQKSYEKALKLQMICEQFGLNVDMPIAFEQRTASLFIINRGGILNPDLYSGFNDVANKAVSYKNDIDVYEKTVFSKLGNNKTI